MLIIFTKRPLSIPPYVAFGLFFLFVNFFKKLSKHRSGTCGYFVVDLVAFFFFGVKLQEQRKSFRKSVNNCRNIVIAKHHCVTLQLRCSFDLTYFVKI